LGNLKFSYLYRDAGNYKKRASVTFSNPDKLSPQSVEKIFRKYFLEECLFIAAQVRIPNCFLYVRGNTGSDDHCFHEFERIEATCQIPTDSSGRSINQLMKEVKHQASLGWKAFDPHSTEDFELP
jgi:hypothetical protein